MSQLIRKDPDVGEDWRQKRGNRMRWLDGIIDSTDMNLSKLWLNNNQHLFTYQVFKILSSVQLFSRVRLFATLWIAARQASLSITISRTSLKLMSIESVMPSSHLILCHPFLLLSPIPPIIRVFSNESALRMRWPSTGVSASASVLPVNTQDWSPLEWTGWISLQSKGLSRFSKWLQLAFF